VRQIIRKRFYKQQKQEYAKLLTEQEKWISSNPNNFLDPRTTRRLIFNRRMMLIRTVQNQLAFKEQFEWKPEQLVE